MKKAVLYLRYSSHKQNEQSIEGQQAKCEEFCRQEGIQIIGSYIDRAVSASKQLKRENFEQMIEDSKKGYFDYVVVYKLDRFSRDRIESAIYKKQLKENGVKVLSATEGINDSIESILLESVLEGLNEYYSAELGQKVKRGMEESWKKGRYLGGAVSIGLKSENGFLVPDPETVHIVKEIFDMVDQGTSLEEVAAICNQKGYRTAQGKPFTKSTVWRAIRNKKYIGIATYNGEEKKIMEPIIDEQQFKRVNADHRSQRKRTRFPLTGKVFCGNCGELMTGVGGTSSTGFQYNYYKCRNAGAEKPCKSPSIQRDVLEETVIDGVNKLLMSEEIDSLIEQIYQYEHMDFSEQLSQLAQRKATLETKINNLVAQIADGAPWRLFQEKIDTYQSEIETIEQKTKELNYQLSNTFSRDEIKELLISYIQKDSKAYRNAVFKNLIKKVVVTGDEEKFSVDIFLISEFEGENVVGQEYRIRSNFVREGSPFATYKNGIVIYLILFINT